MNGSEDLSSIDDLLYNSAIGGLDMYCNNCGKEIDNEAIVCVYCKTPTGRPIPPQSVAPSAPITPVKPQYNDEPPKVGFIILSLFVFVAGAILTATHFIDKKNRAAKAYLIATIISAVCAFLSVFVIYFVFLMFSVFH